MDAALAEAGKSTIKVLQGTSWDMDPHGWLPVLRCKCDKNDPVIFALKLSFDYIRSPSFQSISFLYR